MSNKKDIPTSKTRSFIIGLILVLVTLSIVTLINSRKAEAKDVHVSYYGPGFHGRKTANGEVFNMHGLTTAHKTLPFGTKVKMKCDTTGKSVIVRVNDRGPFIAGRTFDLSKGAAEALGIVRQGTAKVQYEIIK